MTNITRDQILEAMRKAIAVRQCQDDDCNLPSERGSLDDCLCDMNAFAALTAIEELGLKIVPTEQTVGIARKFNDIWISPGHCELHPPYPEEGEGK